MSLRAQNFSRIRKMVTMRGNKSNKSKRVQEEVVVQNKEMSDVEKRQSR